MSTATLTWPLPTTRTDLTPLLLEDIAGVKVSMSADGGGHFSPPVLVPAGVEQTFSASNLTPGVYIFRLVVEDMEGRNSANTDVDAVVTDPDVIAPPSAIVDVVVVIT